MDRHLIPVEIRVERGADERVDPDGLAFDENGLESLNPEAMERRGAVEQHGMLADDFFEKVPHLGPLRFDHFFRGLDRGGETDLFELVVDERLEELERHFLGKTTLVELELGADHDDRTPGIVHTLSEQVLAEAALFSLQRVRERFQRAVIGAPEHTATAAVVEQSVDRFLKHALFVAHDHVRSFELHQFLQAVVAVDDAPIEVVEIARREAAAVEGHERPQLGRDDGNDVQDHPLGPVIRFTESLDDFQTLGEFELLLKRRFRLHRLAKTLRELFDLDASQKLFDSLRAHLGLELALVFLTHLPVALLRQKLVLFERRLAGIDHDIGLEIENPLQIAERHVEQMTDAAREAFEEPDMRHGAGELDMSEPLAPHFRLSNLHTAFVANDAAVLHALVLAAQALPVGYGPEDLGAEKTIPLRFEGAVVDRLRLCHLAMRPGADLFGRCQTDFDGIEIHHQVTFVAKSCERFQILPPSVLGAEKNAETEQSRSVFRLQ